MAQRPGFEPGVAYTTPPFQDGTIDRSDISASAKREINSLFILCFFYEVIILIVIEYVCW